MISVSCLGFVVVHFVWASFADRNGMSRPPSTSAAAYQSQRARFAWIRRGLQQDNDYSAELSDWIVTDVADGMDFSIQFLARWRGRMRFFLIAGSELRDDGST